MMFFKKIKNRRKPSNVRILRMMIVTVAGSFCHVSWTCNFIGYHYYISRLLAYEHRSKSIPQTSCRGSITSLQQAIKEGDTAKCRSLLENGVNANEKDQIGNPPLHNAIFWDRKEICRLLLKNKANINEKDRQGNTGLHKAVFFDRKGVITLLLEEDANVNAKDNSGDTPLHVAYISDRKEHARLLMRYGAHLLTNQEGKTALELTTNREITKIILTYEAIKVAGYLTRIMPKKSIPQVIISLILLFSAGKI